MAEPTGFMDHLREAPAYRPVDERVRDHFEVELPLLGPQTQQQAARCMDCGIPYCHAFGCPVKNRIPEFNEMVRLGRWREAIENLHSTNNFPEFTGRTCPAPCEPSCTLALEDAPVTIKAIENAIIERAWKEGWVTPRPPETESGRRVGIIGSGPAGLAAAQQLRRAGHQVTVYERDDKVGGLLRYGIPDFKLDKRTIDRRLAQLVAEGIEFQTGVEVGADLSAAYMQKTHDALLITIGASVPRDLKVPGRDEAGNVHFAMEYLTQQNRINAGGAVSPEERLNAAGQTVVIIGGGDTGSDCLGTAIRQGAERIYQFNYHDAPPHELDPLTVWPHWPAKMHSSSSHEEGGERRWNVNTTGFFLENNRVKALKVIETTWTYANGRKQMSAVEGSETELPVDLVLLACGFSQPRHEGIVDELALATDERGRVAVTDFATSVDGVFAAGDCVLGASLVVDAIDQGRRAAASIDAFLSVSAWRRS